MTNGAKKSRKFAEKRNRMKIAAYMAALMLLAASCSGGKEYRKAEGAAWGTFYHIVYRADRDLSDSVTAVMRRVELSLSMFDAQSTVSRLNRGETDRVDSMFMEVYRAAVEVNRISGGAFDPTVAPLVNLWGFGTRGDSVAEPSDAEIADSLNVVGIGRSKLCGDILLRVPGMKFDFSAIAKGYGVDCVAAMLRRNGCGDYMVEIGGEVSVAGQNPRGEAWRIAVETPSEDDNDALTTIRLEDCAVATSGNYRNYRQTSGGRVWHTISPLTGRPAPSHIASATVQAPSCMLADALATACMVLAPDSALALADSVPGVIITLVLPDGDGWKTLSAGPAKARKKESAASRQPHIF